MGVVADLTHYLDEHWDEYHEWVRQVYRTPDSYAGPIGKSGWACVYAWASRGDDLVAKSNYKAFVAEMEALDAELQEDWQWEPTEEEYWCDGSANHWLVGVLEQVLVRVVTGDEWEEPTLHGVRAFQLHQELLDYPLLDEDDYSQREYEAINEQWDEVVGCERHEWDTDEEHDQIAALALDMYWDRGDWSVDSVWTQTEKFYDEARNEFFESKVRLLYEQERSDYEQDLIDLSD